VKILAVTFALMLSALTWIGSTTNATESDDPCELALAASANPRVTRDALCDPASDLIARHLGRDPDRVRHLCTPGTSGYPPVLLVFALTANDDAVVEYQRTRRMLMDLHAPLAIILMLENHDLDDTELAPDALELFETLAATAPRFDF
jgi:hypothetical protein